MARDGEQPGDAVADEGPGDAGASSSESVPAANDESFSGKTDRTRVEKFLEKQLRLNVSARGWLETAYYYLGSDYRRRRPALHLELHVADGRLVTPRLCAVVGEGQAEDA